MVEIGKAVTALPCCKVEQPLKVNEKFRHVVGCDASKLNLQFSQRLQAELTERTQINIGNI